jgi:hypothetical protein
LSEVVLEESYVLTISVTPASIEFGGDFVLGPRHSSYREPASGETGCFVRGTLTFLGVRSLLWEHQGAPPALDASGEIDYGHIDDFRWDDNAYELAGEWGQMSIVAAGLDLVLVL